MRHFWGIFLSSLLALSPTVGYAQEFEQEHIHLHQEDKQIPIEHLEIHLPAKLLQDLPAVNQTLSMDEAVRIGLENNLGIKVAQSETEVRKAMLKEARANRLPILSLGSLTFLRAGDSQTLMTPNMMMNTVDSTLFQDLNASARLPLFTGGLIKGRIQAAQFASFGSQAALQQSIVETAFRVREAYLKALFTKTEHLVHQSHIGVQENLLKNAQARYHVGRGLKADVLRIQTELADAQRMLNEEHNELNNALFDLKAAMGVDLASDVSLSEQLNFNPWLGGELKTLIQSALSNQPRLQEAKRRIEEAEAQVRIARSEYYPQLYGQVTGNLRFPDRPPIMGNGVIGMVTATLPVFDRTRSARIEQADAALRKAQQEYKSMELDIAKEIAQMWSELQFAEENVALAKPAVSQAEEDLRLVQRRFDVGRAISVEVQDAALSFRQAQLNQAQAIYNHELAKAKLIRALGEVEVTKP